jgi:hypothetical protein
MFEAGRKRDVRKLLEGKGEAVQENAEVRQCFSLLVCMNAVK